MWTYNMYWMLFKHYVTVSFQAVPVGEGDVCYFYVRNVWNPVLRAHEDYLALYREPVDVEKSHCPGRIRLSGSTCTLSM